jgi:hypothetical protein
MFDPSISVLERTKQLEYLKSKIKETFDLYQKDKKGYCDKRYQLDV